MFLQALVLGFTVLASPPPADFDKDGISDLEDDCPTDPGTVAGRGCPGIAPAAPVPEPAPPVQLPVAPAPKPAPPSRVSVQADRLELKEPIFFETGSARIQARSRRLLVDISQAIRSLAPGSVVSVEGHTDGNGRRSRNVRLSLKRADAVVRRLIKLGVPAARLRSVAHGPDRPLTTNETREGRAKNRRVELLIQS